METTGELYDAIYPMYQSATTVSSMAVYFRSFVAEPTFQIVVAFVALLLLSYFLRRFKEVSP